MSVPNKVKARKAWDKSAGNTLKGKKLALFMGDNLTALIIMNELVRYFVETRQITPVIFLTEAPKSEKANVPETKELNFFETEILNRYIYPFREDRGLEGSFKNPKGKILYTPSQLKQKYQKENPFIEVHRVANVKDETTLALLKNDPDIVWGVSAKNYQIFNSNIIRLFQKRGGQLWNLHTGELPQMRGVFIPLRMLQLGKPGDPYRWTLHVIDKGYDEAQKIAVGKRSISLAIDTGPTIDFCGDTLKKIPILQTYIDMAPLGAQLILDRLQNVLDGYTKLELKKQTGLKDPNNYHSFPTAEDFAEVRQKYPDLQLVNYEKMVSICTQLFIDPDNNDIQNTNLRKSFRNHLRMLMKDWQNGAREEYLNSGKLPKDPFRIRGELDQPETCAPPPPEIA